MSRSTPEMEALLRSLLSRRRAPGCRFDELLAHSVAGTLSPEESTELRAHLDGCAACRESLRQYEAAADHWSESPAQERGLLGRLLARWDHPWMLVSAAVAASILLCLILLPLRGGRQGEGDALISKGSLRLFAVAKRGQEVFRVSDGATLGTGDRIGFSYSSDRAGHLMVFFLDNQGTSVQAFPLPGSSTQAIEPGSEVPLPGSIELTDGAGCEWIIAVFSGTPIEPAKVGERILSMWRRREGCQLHASPGDATGAHPGTAFQILRIQR